ncbi:MAG: type 1 glutamine amidotransferase [Ginsengibacter sp.]
MKKLRIHYFQHVPFEGLGNIEHWCNENEHTLSCTLFYENSNFPDLQKLDWLIIMGGPMGVNDEKKYGWLSTEKEYINQAIEANKTVIGICLGAQLIAQILGSNVYQNEQKEIGWFPIELTGEARKHKLFSGLKDPITVFHWHGDTFDLPKNSIRIASSEACKNQGFLYQNNVLGLQFHLETTKESLEKMIQNGRAELKKAKLIQTETEIESEQDFFDGDRQILFTLLDRLAK